MTFRFYLPPRRDLVAAARLRRRIRNRQPFGTQWVGLASCSITVGRRAFVIDHTGQMHPDWWGTRRLAALAGAVS